jgi:oligopeptide/dipeptide ABC transporter ATP-binding protein
MNPHFALDIRRLKKYFPIMKGLLRREVGAIKAVDDVSLKVRKGEILGLCGESGSGKSTVARCIDRLYKPTSGQIIFEGIDISRMSERELRKVRARMSFVFQDPYSSLNPRQRIRTIVVEPLKIHRSIKRQDCHDRAAQLLQMVGLDASLMNRYPHELSGGQRQRVGIARALAPDPSLVILDEPVSALDPSIQAQVINLLRELHDSRDCLAYLFISHDLSIIQNVSDRVAVLYRGRIVEVADTEELYLNPLHPYTRMLLSAIPTADPSLEKENAVAYLEEGNLISVDGPIGCAFRSRCTFAMLECSRHSPELQTVGGGHEVACLRLPFGLGIHLDAMKMMNVL